MNPDTFTISKTAHIAKESVIVGDVTIGSDSSVFYYTVLRGDYAPIQIGSGTNIQEHCTVHIDEGCPVTIGDGVSIGHNCVIHGCQIGDNTLVGMGSILMNNAKIGRNCLIGAGSLVTQNTEIPDGMLALGNPAKVKRPLTEEEIAHLQANRDVYIEISRKLFGNYGE